jgi:hypothetical protein
MSIRNRQRPRVMRAGSFLINPSSPESIGPTERIWGVAQSQAYTPGSRCLFVPFTIDQIVTAYQMYTQNGTTAANAIDVGIYDARMNSLVTLGGTNQVGTSNLQLFDITDTILVPGRYFMGIVMNGSPPTGTFTNFGNAAQPRHLRFAGCLEKLSTYPLPTGAVTTTTVANGFLPHFGVMLQTVA